MSSISDTAARPHSFQESKLRSLMTFMHRCAPDEFTRCQAVTGLMLTLWQSSGDVMAFRAPWLLLENAGGERPDPLDVFIKNTAAGLGRLTSDEDPESARQCRVIAAGIVKAYHAERDKHPSAGEYYFRNNQVPFLEYCSRGFGSSHVGYYAERFDKHLQLVAPGAKEILLRLEREADWRLFHRHICQGRKFFENLVGYNDKLLLERKVAYVSGSVPSRSYGQLLVDALVSEDLPMVFLPHLADCPLKLPDSVNFNVLLCTLATRAAQASRPWVPELPDTPWRARYEERLRSRLRHFPASYEAFIQRTVREIITCCAVVVSHACATGDVTEERDALYRDLRKMCLRGLALGIEGLAYHGYGFDGGCSREDLRDFVDLIRALASTTRRDLQRRFPRFNSTQRDKVLEILADEGLVELSGKTVKAVTWRDFVRQLPTRPALTLSKFECPPLMQAWKT
jgi:hypothetical protein